uniref:Uncharacterized protein n=1 Tax=mine drainage metagenome TaxID=410659 RepID=E6QRJ3_9ZZZZ
MMRLLLHDQLHGLWIGLLPDLRTDLNELLPDLGTWLNSDMRVKLAPQDKHDSTCQNNGYTEYYFSQDIHHPSSTTDNT